LAGTIGASIVTWFTFLFSFVFILAGAPIIESTHNELKFTAPLTAITAAVVGVILNLALFFAYHVLWPTGFNGSFDIVVVVGVGSFDLSHEVNKTDAPATSSAMSEKFFFICRIICFYRVVSILCGKSTFHIFQIHS
jgi:hypothetical protein